MVVATADLCIEDLHVSVEGKEIVRGVNLTLRRGEVHALMGPNGSGKSTLANALMGHPRYQVTSGRLMLSGEDLLQLPANERAQRGLFLAFQYPQEIPGVRVGSFLRTAVNAGREKPLSATEFHRLLLQKMKMLEMDTSFAMRYLNDGFSGGEKKRNEILQMAILQPEFAILDETDSGLDVDALRIVAGGVNKLVGPDLAVLLITHYTRILNYIQADYVHVLLAGRIVRSGGRELANELEKQGYDWLIKEAQEAGLVKIS